IDSAKSAGVTAIIASDQAAIFYARQIGVEVHISTQLNVCNIETLAFYAQFADVVVLARELNLEQVRYIYEQIRERDIRGPRGELVEIEMFVHGALCMAVSGKCYLSLHDANFSANKGSCRQICRRSYLVKDLDTGSELVVENEHIMSPKDLCTIDFLDRVLDAGVRVLKIEGRARPAEYVKRVCECYNEAIDSILEDTYTEEKIVAWKEKLSTVFNRGFWGGYYLGQRLGEWSRNYGSSATRTKVYVGKVTNFFSKLGVAELLIEASPLSVGEEVIITGETTGVVEMVVTEIREDEKSVDKVIQGVKCSFVTPQPVRRNDKLYRLEIK
ncbi:MAG: U32 family peptidase, partial [Rikenellaceae bacterium]